MKQYVYREGAVPMLNVGRGTDLKLPIYMDYQATTPVDPRVFEAMKPYFCEDFGNPHSGSHSHGWKAKAAMENAREQVAKLIGAAERDIIFTSGATESNNLAIIGTALYSKGQKRNKIITLKTEHKCVLASCYQTEKDGFKVIYLPVQPNGLVDLELLRKHVDEETLLVSVMAVNNEIGVIQPIAEIGKICREKGAFFHTDAAQAFGKIPLNVDAMNIDLMSISGHKIYGPKGIGALYIRRKPARVRLNPLIHGGGQERGFRSGTMPTMLIVGLGKAAEIAGEEMELDSLHAKDLFFRMYNPLMKNLAHVYLNGDLNSRYYGNLNLSFAYIEGESLMMRMQDVSVSSGSACTSNSLEPSYVLKALGVSEDLAHSSIRFGFGRFTTVEEVDFALQKVEKAVDALREISPLWEMIQQGVDLSKIEWVEH